MDMHHFEDRIKNAFRHHRPEVDTDAIWENIEPRLKKKKKRRGFLWWLLPIGVGTLLLWLPGKKEEMIVQADTTMPGQIENRLKSQTASTGRTFRMKEQSENSAAFNEKKNFPDANRPVSGVFYRFLNDENTGPVVGIEQKKPTQQRKTIDFVSMEVLPGIWLGNVTSVDSVPKSRVLPGSEKEVRERHFSIGKEDKLEKNKRKRHSKSRWEHNLGIQAGPGFGLRYLGKGEATTAFQKMRRKTESSLESVTASVFYSAASGSGFVLKTGFDFRQINEKFHLESIKHETVQVNGVISQLVDGDGNVIQETVGLKPVYKTSIYSNTSYNRYRFINMPFGVGYRRKVHRNLRVELSGGIDLNLMFRAKATLAGSEQTQVVNYSYSKVANSEYFNMFRKKMGWGIWGAYAYDWKWTDRLRWQLSGSIQIPLRQVTNTEFTVAQRYFNFGVQAGVTYRLVNTVKKG